MWFFNFFNSPVNFYSFDLIFFILSTFIIFIFGVHFSDKNVITLSENNNMKFSSNLSCRVYPILTPVITSLSILALFLVLFIICKNGMYFSGLFSNSILIDQGVFYAKIVIIAFAICCLFASFNYLSSFKFNSFEYITLLNIALLGILLVASSFDFILVYLAIELQSLSFYILASLKRNSVFSTEAGLKYFILGAVSSGFLLLGISLIYGYTGLTNFEELIQYFLNGDLNNVIILGLLFIIVAFLFKLTAAPFHMWSPDVYEGAPTIISMFFAVVPKFAIVVLLIRILVSVFFDYITIWQPIILLSAFVSILISTFASIKQTKIKRFLAYSSIAHIGFILLGVAVGTAEGIQGAIFYSIAYVVMTIGVWAFVLTFYSYSNNNISYISDLASFYRINPIIAITFLAIMFSMAGVPPFLGFFSKFFIFFATIEASFYFISIICILMSVIGSYYYIRFVKVIFFENSANWVVLKPIHRSLAFVLGLVLIIIACFIFYPNILYLFSHKLAYLLCI